jgi:hypothetical protein
MQYADQDMIGDGLYKVINKRWLFKIQPDNLYIFLKKPCWKQRRIHNETTLKEFLKQPSDTKK